MELLSASGNLPRPACCRGAGVLPAMCGNVAGECGPGAEIRDPRGQRRSVGSPRGDGGTAGHNQWALQFGLGQGDSRFHHSVEAEGHTNTTSVTR